MDCTNPKKAYKHGLTEANRKQKLVFKKPEGFIETKDNTQKVSCGKCISCKLSYAKEWALRITHDSSLNKENSFITLTFNDKYLPNDHGVHREDVVQFIKRLRRRTGKKFKTFYCGEYGEKYSRPHYHIILLGYDFPDKQFLKTSPSGNTLWESKRLTKTWSDPKTKESKGWANIGEVTYDSAGYVARYCMKKQKDHRKYEFVDGYDEETGEIYKHNLPSEFIGMSQGIGKTWHDIFKTDTDKDYITQNGYKHKIPRYYDKQREKTDPESLEKLKEERQRKALENESENTKSRLVQKATIKEVQNKMLKRSFEEND